MKVEADQRASGIVYESSVTGNDKKLEKEQFFSYILLKQVIQSLQLYWYGGD